MKRRLWGQWFSVTGQVDGWRYTGTDDTNTKRVDTITYRLPTNAIKEDT